MAPLLCLSLGARALPADADTRSARALRVDGGVHVDGALDELAWQQAAPIGAFVQTEPQQGAPPSEATEVRILYDSESLYFGVRCFDRTPAGIVSTQLARDADLGSDDRILIVLDPFFDQRNGFFFLVNPAGARADGQIANNAERINLDWDGIWRARARRTDEGWTAEIAIPFKTLRFKPGQAVWGLNVERQIKRLQEIDRWAAARRDVWISNLAEAGQLSGLEGLQQGRGLDLRPYASGGRSQGEDEWKAGLDVVKNLTPSLNASFTLNTDFAETEVDERRVNLTRFPLFFPEKRAFFLEGAGVYEIAGLRPNNGDLLPFFSRRIGLSEGREVPVRIGAKLSGRVGGFNLGLLDVRTGRSEELELPGRNLLAARVTRNLFRQSWLGAIVTHGNPAGRGDNTLLGADARLATSGFRGGKNLSLDLYLFRSDDQASGAADYAFGGKLDYPNDLWDVALNWKQIGRDFRPALGFAPRTGIRKASGGASFMPRPGRLGVRQLFFELDGTHVAVLGGRVESWSLFAAPVGLLFESGDVFEWNLTREFERLSAPFEVQPGVVLSPASYEWGRQRLGLQTAEKRRWEAELALSWGGFYAGRLRGLGAELALKPSPHLALGVAFEQNDASLPEGRFRTRILAARFEYRASPDLSWNTLVQYDSDSRLLGAQSRLRWILRPGNDLFLVVNRGWARDTEGRFLPRFDGGSLKLQYTIRL